jgi:hypothetical protein
MLKVTKSGEKNWAFDPLMRNFLLFLLQNKKVAFVT